VSTTNNVPDELEILYSKTITPLKTIFERNPTVVHDIPVAPIPHRTTHRQLRSLVDSLDRQPLLHHVL